MLKTTMELISVYGFWISITLTLAESDTFENQRTMVGGYIYPGRLGFLQCKSLCYRYGGCGALSYLPKHCLCELHGLNSGRRDMSDHRGSVTWIKNVSDKESCRECRSFCHGEEQCLITRRGEFKCVPAKRYFADEMGFKSARIHSNVDLQYLGSWGLSQEQMCRKHKDKYQRKHGNIPIGEKTTVYYMLIKVQRTQTTNFKTNTWSNAIATLFKLKCNSKVFLTISAARKSFMINVIGGKPMVYYYRLYPSDLKSGLQMDIAVLFCPRRNILSAFVLKFGTHKVTKFDFRKSHGDILPSSRDDFCLQTSSDVVLNAELGLGVSSKLLPIEESKQYMGIWENATNALFDEKISGNK